MGNLRGVLLREARGMLEEGQPLHLRALAARAGITAGSMYHHYESKTELLGELAAGGFKELRQDLEAADRVAAATGTRLRSWAATYFRFAQREPSLFALMFDPEVAHLEPVAEARAATLAVLHAVVAEVSAAQGRVDPPLDQITLAIWAAAHGTATLGPTAATGQAELVDEVIVGLDALFRGPRS